MKLKNRILIAYDNGLTAQQTSEGLGVSTVYIRRILRRNGIALEDEHGRKPKKEYWSVLTQDQQDACWSMLMNLNGEADKYFVPYQAYDNRDVAIGKRLRLNSNYVGSYLGYRAKKHLKQINERINKNYKPCTTTQQTKKEKI